MVLKMSTKVQVCHEKYNGMLLIVMLGTILLLRTVLKSYCSMTHHYCWSLTKMATNSCKVKRTYSSPEPLKQNMHVCTSMSINIKLQQKNSLSNTSPYKIQVLTVVKVIYHLYGVEQNPPEQKMFLLSTYSTILCNNSPFCIHTCIFRKPYIFIQLK